MQPPNRPNLHLTYCQNIHPGETWSENLAALQNQATAVRQQLDYRAPFGVGLRLGAQSAEDLQKPEALEQGSNFFSESGLYPFSINGFPYGRFHKGPVKERVYAPDWRSPERLQYTIQLAHILSKWLPEGQEGSISTVPGSYAKWIQTPEDQAAMARSLGHCCAELARIERQTGHLIHLGLEPEPDCFLETTPQTLTFFESTLPEGALPEIRKILGVDHSEAESLLRRHIGVCFDTCHVALQFENPADSLRQLAKAGIRISKIQLSAALRAPGNEASREALSAFSEPTYLHQVKAITREGNLTSWSDLPEALRSVTPWDALKELRVHFHVPLFVAPASPLLSTTNTLDEGFWDLVCGGICPHLEIETYTFDVLPPEVHPGDIVQSIAAEYRWVLNRLKPSKPHSLPL